MYATVLTRENSSAFVYMDPLDHVSHEVRDRHYQANMFRVRGAAKSALFHAVVAQETHRFSVGIALSDKMAMRLLRAVIPDP